MTEPDHEAGGVHADRPRGLKRPRVRVDDLALIVRPPGRPGEIRAYTDAERDEAERYAGATGAAVERLGS